MDASESNERMDKTMSEKKPLIDFPGRIVFIGFGSIGQGVLPLVLRHVGIPAERVTIVTAEDRGVAEAAQYGVKFIKEPLTRENFRTRRFAPDAI